MSQIKTGLRPEAKIYVKIGWILALLSAILFFVDILNSPIGVTSITPHLIIILVSILFCTILFFSSNYLYFYSNNPDDIVLYPVVIAMVSYAVYVAIDIDTNPNVSVIPQIVWALFLVCFPFCLSFLGVLFFKLKFCEAYDAEKLERFKVETKENYQNFLRLSRVSLDMNMQATCEQIMMIAFENDSEKDIRQINEYFCNFIKCDADIIKLEKQIAEIKNC